ncbi:IclR family transcriptional regulator [Desulfoglaeba alkanexedens ALDC]|uniref:IclR family transcriptional regulator n=2 Tax=Desulfoglaeba alkanexedens TaxID=361111 RepID=A0A4P8L855_9BACT|nr:IclR family transcriptional regulator [Desulfoglaeba alkanexedens ALDC]
MITHHEKYSAGRNVPAPAGNGPASAGRSHKQFILTRKRGIMGQIKLPAKPRSFITSLARGLQVLEALARSSKPLNLTQLSEEVGFHKVTTSRFCYTLTELGYVERIHKKRYRLTPKALGLGYAIVCNLDLRQVGESHLRELSAFLGETVNMAVLDQTEILYVARFKTEQIMPTELHIGSRLPLHCTSMGKAILAHLPEEELSELLDRITFSQLTHRTITTREGFLEELEKVRKQCYAVSDEELSVGLRSIAAPIMRDNRPVAAINIAVPTARYNLEQLAKNFSGPLLKTAKTISDLLQQQVTVQPA